MSNKVIPKWIDKQIFSIEEKNIPTNPYGYLLIFTSFLGPISYISGSVSWFYYLL